MLTLSALDQYNALPLAKKDENEVTWEGIRVRLIRRSALPIFVDSAVAGEQENVIVLDLTSEKTADKILSAETEPSPPKQPRIDYESEGGDSDPLEFSFVTVDKLEGKTINWTGDITVSLASDRIFKANPIPDDKFMQLIQKFHNKRGAIFESSLSQLPIIAIASGRNSFGLLMSSISKARDKKRWFTNTRFLGRCDNQTVDALEHLEQNFSTSYETKTIATAVYRILSSSSLAPTKVMVPGKVTISLKWSAGISPLSFLETPDPSACVTIRCQPGWCDPQMPLCAETVELSLILDLAKWLTTGTPAKFANSTTNCREVVQRIQELIESNANKNEPELENNAARMIDFTEQLWAIFKNVDSYQTVVAGMKVVFDAIKERRIVPAIHHDNRTSIARLIRDSHSGQLMLPRLEALTPIQFLLEIGVESFRRFLGHTFLRHFLVVNADELSVWMDSSSTEVEDTAFALLPLHLSLIILVKIRDLVTLEDSRMTQLSRQVLSELTSAKSIDVNTIVFETNMIVFNLMPGLFERIRPVRWFNETWYSHKGQLVSYKMTHFSAEALFNHLEDQLLLTTKKEKITEEEPIDDSTSVDLSSECGTSSWEFYMCSVLTATIVPEDL